MERGLQSAFAKIEKQLEKKKDEEAREEARQKFLEVQAREERRRKQQAFLTYSALFLFMFSLASLVYYADQQGYFKEVKIFTASNTTDDLDPDDIDCRLPSNWSRPVCVEFRKNQLDNNWSNLREQRSGRTRAFAVHGKDNKKRKGSM